jgi:hypothetical protein
MDNNIDESATKLWRPFDEEFDENPRIAKEKMVLLPFDYLGKALEDSDRSADYVKSWYTDAVVGALAIISKDHSMVCTRNRANHNYLMCDQSAVCPQRYLEQYLVGDSLLPIFNRQMYSNHPWRARQITIDKLHLGVNNEVLLPIDADTLETRYELQFNGWLSSHMRYHAWSDPFKPQYGID